MLMLHFKLKIKRKISIINKNIVALNNSSCRIFKQFLAIENKGKFQFIRDIFTKTEETNIILGFIKQISFQPV